MVLPVILASRGEKVIKEKLLSFAMGEKLKPAEVLKDLSVNIKDFFAPGIKKYIKEARDIAEKMPESEYKELLHEFPVYICKEMLKEGDIRLKL